MSTVPMAYLEQGNFTEALSWAMTDYVGFGLLWMFIGLILFGVTYAKTGSFGISGMVFLVYSVTIGAFLPPEIAMYFYLIIAFLIFALIAKIYFGK